MSHPDNNVVSALNNLDKPEHRIELDAGSFLDQLDANLIKLDWPREILSVVSVRNEFSDLERVQNYLEFEVSFSNGGERSFVAFTGHCVCSFFSKCEKDDRHDLDCLLVEGNPMFIVLKMTPLAIYNGIIKYLMFEQDVWSQQKSLGLQVKFSVELSELRDYHSLS